MAHAPQTLIVTAGCGRVKRWGGLTEEIRPENMVWIRLLRSIGTEPRQPQR